METVDDYDMVPARLGFGQDTDIDCYSGLPVGPCPDLVTAAKVKAGQRGTVNPRKTWTIFKWQHDEPTRNRKAALWILAIMVVAGLMVRGLCGVYADLADLSKEPTTDFLALSLYDLPSFFLFECPSICLATITNNLQQSAGFLSFLAFMFLANHRYGTV